MAYPEFTNLPSRKDEDQRHITEMRSDHYKPQRPNRLINGKSSHQDSRRTCNYRGPFYLNSSHPSLSPSSNITNKCFCDQRNKLIDIPVCYGDYVCPRYQARIHSSQLYLDPNDRIQQQSPPHSQRVSLVSLQSRYDEFYDADADPEDDTISYPGSPMREEEDGVPTVSGLSNDDLREALILANNHAGTNFNFQEIEDEMTLAILRTGTQTQLAAALTQICTQKASDSDGKNASDEGSQHPDETDHKIAWDKPFRCFSCQKGFRSETHLRQHLVTHTIERRTCKLCGQVLKSPSSRRVHERMHRETDNEREERLRKRRVPRDQTKTGVEVQRQNRHKRVPHVLG